MKSSLLFLCLSLISGLVLSLDTVQVTLTQNSLRPTSNPSLPWRFTSFSIEWDIVQYYFGATGKSTTRPSMVNLLNNLKNLTGGSPVLRIGGNSADYSWWNPTGQKPYPHRLLTYSITESDHKALQAICDATGSTLILGLNFLNGTDSKWAVSHLQNIPKNIKWSSVEALEVGNEVDLFFTNGIRNSTYGPADYRPEYEYYVNSLSATNLLPQKQFFQGATYAGLPSFFQDLPDYMARENSTAKEFSIHSYPLTACRNSKPKLVDLMQDHQCQYWVQRFSVYSRKALELGSSLSMGETNSVSCSGKAGISNTFGAALWALDWMINYANYNFTGTNWHSHQGAPYNFVSYTKGSDVPQVQPLYNALYFWGHFSGKGFSVVPTILKTSNPLIKVWCVKDTANGNLRCLVIHKDIVTTQDASVKFEWNEKDLQGYNPQITMREMTCPNPTQSKGIKVAGQTFEGSRNGLPLGKVVVRRLTYSRKGEVVTTVATVKRASAAIFEISKK